MKIKAANRKYQTSRENICSGELPIELMVLLVRAIGDKTVIDVTLEIECFRIIFLAVCEPFASDLLISFRIL